MSVYASGRPHDRARLIRPHAYRSSVADPPRWPRLILLRSSCGHLLGVGYVWKTQGYIAWRRCGR